MGPDQGKAIHTLAWAFPCITKHIVYRWGVCQTLSCQRQLEGGVRYFDFRIAATRPNVQKCPCHSSDDVRVLHGLFGCEVKDALKEIKDFLGRHPGEVAILDFNHWYNFSRGEQVWLVEELLQIFNRKLCPRPRTVRDTTLQSIVDRGQQVIIFCDFGMYIWPRASELCSILYLVNCRMSPVRLLLAALPVEEPLGQYYQHGRALLFPQYWSQSKKR